MKKIFKRTVSAVLAMALCIGVILGAGYTLGTDRVAAASDYTSELWMLEDYDYVLMRGEKQYTGPSIYAAEGGTAYIPMKPVAQYAGASYVVEDGKVSVTLKNGRKAELTLDSCSWTKEGVEQTELLLPPVYGEGDVFISVLTCKSVFSLNTFNYIDMGLVVLSENRMSYDRSYKSMTAQLTVLGSLLFDRPDALQIGTDFDNATGAGVHPRLMVDRDRFDIIREYYNNPDLDFTVYNWIISFAQKGVSFFSNCFTVDGNGRAVWKSDMVKEQVRQPYYLYDEAGNRLVGVSTYDYTNPDGTVTTLVCEGSGIGEGYDVGGRSRLANISVRLKQLAFVWQMTGEKKYADAFYLLAVELGKWEHWGEGHFLDCADGAVEFALGLDWIYHAFDDEPDKRNEMAEILYNMGLMKGYYSIKNDTTYIHQSSLMNGQWKTTNRTNNWQTVCGSGMIVSALYLMDYSEYRDNCLFVIESYLESLEKCLPQYAPDGSYIESPGYWVYGTNTYFIMLASLESALGTDYGYYDTIGLQDSCYYAQMITDSDFYSWGFHDGGMSQVNRSCFYLASKAYNDPELAYMRDYMLFERDIPGDILDILFYEPGLSDGATGEMPLDRNHLGIDTVTMRSGWESGSLFAGLHAGANAVAHGDIDSGNFYLEMGGVLWVGDPGTEDYNVGGYFGSERYYYYRKTLEAHNTILIRSDALKQGQVTNTQSQSHATITTYYTDENGAYAIANMKPQYGSTCTSATRGLLLTNSRSTVVLQDEISFSTPTNLTWIAAVKNVYEISEDGRTAYARGFYNNKQVTLRVTLITEDDSLGFQLLKSQTILDSTITKSNSGNERASDPENRLIINKDGATDFNVSVVFEIMRDPAEIVAYEPVPMATWQTSDDQWVKDANSHIVYPEEIIPPKYKLSDFVRANKLLSEAKTLEEMGKLLLQTRIYLTDYDVENAQVKAAADQYTAYLDEYNRRVRQINEIFSGI